MSTFIHPTAIIGPHVELGDNVWIGAYAVIGTRAEHRDYWQGPLGSVWIGNNVVIREFTTINAGTTTPTTVRDNVWMLRGSHVGHDAYIENDVTLSCNVLIGGHARVFQHSNLGLGSVVHQWCAVPSYTMLGMNSTWTKTTPTIPMSVYVGSPAKRLKENKYLIDKHNLQVNHFAIENERCKTWLKNQQR